MPRAEANKEYNTFVAGLITEASPLTYPENSSLDELNFVLSRKGDRRRRQGIDYETGFALTDTGHSQAVFETLAISSYEWINVNDIAGQSITVVQIGTKLYFFDRLTSAVSSNILNAGEPITIDASGQQVFQYSAILGTLIVTTGRTAITTLEYDTDNDEIIVADRPVFVRDLFGVEDELGIIVRPSALTTEHRYNLFNQGWDDSKINSFKTAIGTYPSNADIWHLGKDADDNFDPELLVKQDFGSSPAAKGSTIINAFSRGAERKVGGRSPRWKRQYRREPGGDNTDFNTTTYIIESGATLPTDITEDGCTAVASYAGHVFYAGAGSVVTDGDGKSPSLNAFVFFSQLLENMEKATACYQEADPTSEHDSLLVDTDGGFIKISGASGVQRLVTIEAGVVVFASTGVWMITGGDGGFSADDFIVHKITDVGSVGAESVVAAGSQIFYLADDGMYVLTPDQVTGRLQTQDISKQTIQSLYLSIPKAVLVNSKAVYDRITAQVRWMYSNLSDYDGDTDRYHFNAEIVLDLTLGGFYKLEIKELTTNSPYIADYLTSASTLITDADAQLNAEGDLIEAGGLAVVIPTQNRTINIRSSQYLTVVPGATYSFTISEYNRDDFNDWFTNDGTGVDAAAFLLTGYETLQDTQRNKKATYITTHFSRTETGFDADLNALNASSCLLQAQWGWANSANSGRWSDVQEVYRLNKLYIPTGASDPYDYGFAVVTTKNRMRGKGEALSLLFQTSPGKDCHLLGWANNYTGNIGT